MAYTRGELIEFTDGYHRHYPPADETLVRFGVCAETTDAHSPRVMIADGSVVTAAYVYSSGWAGWMPEDLETVWESMHTDHDQRGGGAYDGED